MITNRIIQAWYDKANSIDTDVMKWSDFLDCMTEKRNTDTPAYTENPVVTSGLPVYADESAAQAAGLNTGQLYQTSTGEIRVKLESV